MMHGSIGACELEDAVSVGVTRIDKSDKEVAALGGLRMMF
jgi:hypothetical protein